METKRPRKQRAEPRSQTEPLPSEPLAVRVSTAAKLLQVDVKTVRKLGNRGELELIQIAPHLLLVNFASLKRLSARIRRQVAA